MLEGLLDGSVLWKLIAAAAGIFGAVAALVCLVLRLYLQTLSRGQSTLFEFVNDHEARLGTLEKIAIATNPNDTIVMRALLEGGKKDA